MAAVDDSFNCISVEGHMSTNDTVLLLANGAAGGQPLAGDDLAAVPGRRCARSASIWRKQIPDDGEGATHLITIDVQGCATRDDAFRIAKTVADSALVKTAIAGADPNWGRIVSAAGYARRAVRSRTPVAAGQRHAALPATARPSLSTPRPSRARSATNRETHVLLELGEGDAAVRFWTSDLTVDYVKFNADYRT